MDCRKSDADWIIHSIQNSILSKIYDLSNIDWKIIEINAATPTMYRCVDLYNKGYSTIDIAKELNFSEKSSTVSRILKKCADLGLCDYNPKESRRKASAHSVVLTNTGEIFEYLEDAIKTYGCSNISACCSGEIISAGKMDDGTPMIWRYLEDYHADEDYTYNNKVIKKIICIETGKIYNKIIDAANEYGIKDSSISNNLTKRQSFAGRDKITKMPLHWMYYDEFLNSTKENIDNYINNCPLRYSSIICLNTLKIYASASEALSDCSLSTISPITDCCKGKTKTAGFVNGEKARWMYYKDYIKSDLYKNQVA